MKRMLKWLLVSTCMVILMVLATGMASAATDISNAMVTVGGYSGTYSADYTGSAITPEVVVKVRNSSGYYYSYNTLSNGTDYTVSYNNNVNAGTATVTITGINDYTGVITKNFTIDTVSISSSKVKISVADATYTGYTITPSVTITYNNKTLRQGTDYTLSTVTEKNAGSASVTITGTGNFSSYTTKSFTINKKNLNTCTVSVSDQKYTGRALQPTVTVYNGSLVVPSDDYSVSYSNNTNIGTATVTVTAASSYYSYSSGNYTGTGTGTFKIKYDISNCTFTIGKCTYTGSAVTPELTIKANSKALTKGSDYSVAVSNNINAGQGKLTITGSGYYIGTVTKSFTIEPKSITLATATLILPEEKYVYNGSAFTPDVTVADGTTALVKDKDYTLTYKTNKNPGYGYAVITGKGNYGSSQKLKFSIYPSTPKISKIEQTAKNSVTLSWKKGPSGLKYIIYRNGSKIGTTKKNATSYKDTKSKTNGKNYAYQIVAVPSNASSLTSEMSAKKNCYYLKAPTIKAYVAGSRVLSASWSKNSKADGYQVQWSTSSKFSSKKTSTVKKGASLSKTLGGLVVGRTYYFRVRAYKTVEEKYEVVTTTTNELGEEIQTTETKTKKVKYYSSWSNTASKAPITATAHSSAS